MIVCSYMIQAKLSFLPQNLRMKRNLSSFPSKISIEMNSIKSELVIKVFLPKEHTSTSAPFIFQDSRVSCIFVIPQIMMIA